ncbi:MAG: hypothetical protein R3F59_03230 [Myxococcota bacterium]
MSPYRFAPLLCLALAPACDDLQLCGDSDGDGSCDAYDTCPYHPAAPDTGPIVRGTVTCVSPDGTTSDTRPLTSFPIHTQLGEGVTDCTGTFTLPVDDAATLSDGPVEVGFAYQGDVHGPAGSVTELRVMDDLHEAWGTGAFHFGFSQTVQGTVATEDGRTVLQLDPLLIDTSECEIWRVGTEVVEDYQEVRRIAMPGGKLEFMRRAGVFGTSPYAFYSYVDLASNFLDLRPERARRERTLFHESAHVVRDLDDGDASHWDGDNVNYRYARCHRGTEIFEEPYAFHEGWADYWAQARRNGRAHLTGPTTVTSRCDSEAGPVGLALTPDHVDWVEHLLADRLLDLADCVGEGDPDLGDRRMLQALEDNRGLVHSLFEFESALCADRECCGLDRAEPPAKCPPDYHDDGLSCSGPDGHVIRHYRG